MVNLVRCFVEKFALNVNVRGGSSRKKTTCFEHAIENGSMEVVEYLLSVESLRFGSGLM